MFGIFKKTQRAAIIYRLEEQIRDIETRYSMMETSERTEFARHVSKTMNELSSLFPTANADEARSIAAQERQFARMSLSNPSESLAHGLLATFFETVEVSPDSAAIAERCLRIAGDAEELLRDRSQTASERPKSIPESVSVRSGSSANNTADVEVPDFSNIVENVIAAFRARSDTYSPFKLLSAIDEEFRNELSINGVRTADSTLAKIYLEHRLEYVGDPDDWGADLLDDFHEEVVHDIRSTTDDGKKLGLLYFALYLYCLKHRSSFEQNDEFLRTTRGVEDILRRWCSG